MQLISKMFGGLICGAVCFSAAFADDTMTMGPANVDQIPGNIAIIQQQNNRNTASIEQQAILGAAYANEAVIKQYGIGGSASVTQTQGQQNAAGIAQYGNNEKAKRHAERNEPGGSNQSVHEWRLYCRNSVWNEHTRSRADHDQAILGNKMPRRGKQGRSSP